MKAGEAIAEIQNEYQKAIKKFPKFNSTHEGYAVLLEEVEELWDLVKRNKGPYNMKEEAKQVGAMALRFMTDCC